MANIKYNKLIPELSVFDFKKSLKFYTKILGFKIEYTRKKFAFLSKQGSQIMIEEINDHWKTAKREHPFGRGMNLQIEVKNIDPILQELKTNKYVLFRNPQDNWYNKENMLIGCREFLVQDPNGYLLRFSQDIGIKTIR